MYNELRVKQQQLLQYSMNQIRLIRFESFSAPFSSCSDPIGSQSDCSVGLTRPVRDVQPPVPQAPLRRACGATPNSESRVEGHSTLNGPTAWNVRCSSSAHTNAWNGVNMWVKWTTKSSGDSYEHTFGDVERHTAEEHFGREGVWCCAFDALDVAKCERTRTYPETGARYVHVQL